MEASVFALLTGLLGCLVHDRPGSLHARFPLGVGTCGRIRLALEALQELQTVGPAEAVTFGVR